MWTVYLARRRPTPTMPPFGELALRGRNMDMDVPRELSYRNKNNYVNIVEFI